MSDTPETVEQKMRGARLAMAAFVHYIAENHPGDWQECWCWAEGGKE